MPARLPLAALAHAPRLSARACAPTRALSAATARLASHQQQQPQHGQQQQSPNSEPSASPQPLAGPQRTPAERASTAAMMTSWKYAMFGAVALGIGYELGARNERRVTARRAAEGAETEQQTPATAKAGALAK